MILSALWTRLTEWVSTRIAREKSIAAFLQKHAPAWSRVGRVTLHLAENKSDPDCPFAFMASYASGLSQSGRLTQLPLGKALQEYSGAKNKAALLKLLTPLHAAAQSCPLMAELVEAGDVFHPLAWTPQEAYEFLRHIPAYEDAGLMVRLPNWWKKRGNRPQVAATIGEKSGSSMGLDALLDFKLNVVIDGHTLSPKEIQSLLAGDDGLVLFRGQWIEVDREKLRQALDHWKSIASGDGIGFIEGMRLLAGAPANLKDSGELEENREWAFAQPGSALEETLRRLVSPYILRRLKTDKSIINDLPDKTEMKVFCGLTTAQARLYQQTAAALAGALETASGIERRGLVLAYLMRFKQICNHPDQLTKSGTYEPSNSSKFIRLAALCEEIASRGEKVLTEMNNTELLDFIRLDLQAAST